MALRFLYTNQIMTKENHGRDIIRLWTKGITTLIDM